MLKILCLNISILLCAQVLFAQPLAIPFYTKLENFENYYQIDSLKEAYNKLDFLLIKESTLDMYNNYESAIVMPLKEGTWYSFVFVGSKNSKSYQARLFDYEDKKLVTLNQKSKDAEGNVLSFNYVPKFSEFHALRIVQINKLLKKPFGYLLLFKKKVNKS